MAQFHNWENTKLVVNAHHNDLVHSAQIKSWENETKDTGVAWRKQIFALLVTLVALFAITGSTQAQSHFDTEPYLERLNAALAAGNYLDAYGEFFQINDSAPAIMKAVYEAVPETDADKQMQAFFLMLSGRAEDALEAVDTLPESAFSYMLQAAANDMLGNTEAAAVALEQAIELADDDAQVYGLIATAAFVNFNVESMMINSERALELDPDLALAYRIHGMAALFSGDPQTALADADQGIELDPTLYVLHTLRANIRLTLGEPSAALAELDAALAINPDSYIVNRIRSGVNEALGNMEAAAQDFANSVHVKTIEIVEGAELEEGEPVTLTMTLGRTFHLPFEAQADQEFTISVTNVDSSEVDPVVMVLSPDGVPLAFNDDANDETLDSEINEYTLPESGAYTVVISHANGGSEGDIRVLFSLS